MSQLPKMTRTFLKWPGGKSWIAEYVALLAKRYLTPEGTYFEPFLGSGAAFFALKPHKAVLSDVNSELIDTYKIVRDSPDKVIRALKNIPVNKATYYTIRNSKPRTAINRAVRFLYLNRTSFAGIYRLNRRGNFNVPFNGGERDTSLFYKTAILHEASAHIQSVELLASDFENIVKCAGEGDVVYCDPTYTVAHNNNGFIRYNENNFSWVDQQRLYSVNTQAVNRGATVIVTNAFHHSIHRLYCGWRRITLKRISTICPNSSCRREIKESLFILSPKCLRKTQSRRTF